MAAAAAACVLAGCASPSRDDAARPAVAALFPQQQWPQGADALQLKWQDYFVDARLRELIALALDNNRDLRMALHRTAQARAMFAAQRAERFPVIGVSAGVDRSRVPGDLNLTGMPVIGSRHDVGIGVASWEIDLWGRLQNLQDAALENFLATQAGRRAAAAGLVAEVANGYLALRETDERLALARRFTASRAESLRIFTRRMEEGATSRLNVTQVETLLMQARALGVQLEQSRAAQAHALTLLIGAPVDLAPAADLLAEHELVGDADPGLPSDMLLGRPDIAAAEHQLQAENANVGAARAAFFPRVVLTASAGTASAELKGLFAAGSSAWVFSPLVSLPLFDGGRRRANLGMAEARRQQAVANYEKTVQGAFRDVADAFSARRWSAEQAAIAQSALAVQTERARLAQLRYDNGAAAYLEVLDAQRDLLAAGQQRVQARRLALASRVGVYAALGGGSLAMALAPEAP
ncbi:multidrug efflux system outer membrane protein [Variovorax paradoxus]|uniref:efflux transporter outer membrane subunit n=1 Tax=Variovorax paradoxus TaxID=34073 RepID=UPI001AE74B31|nr:efflux transporter outer membrane subunit [Variovorax paradoxus]MDP9964520.1 multidrug efflux system outer membrane protein [Variovorax paradoxus]